MVILTAGYWIFTVIGIVSTFYTTLLCAYIIKKYTLKLKTWKKLEYQLILFRVLFDALNSFISAIYFCFNIFALLYPDTIPFNFSFLIALLASNFLEMRSYLAAIIAIERVLATTIPIHFYRYRKRISNIPIIGFTISTGIASYVVLFGFCRMRFPLEIGCTSFNCATPLCYQNYLVISKLIYASTNAVFSGILCIKLLLLSLNRTIVATDLRKANLLSLTDGLSTLSFELIPSLIFNYGIIDSRSLGPVMGVLRQFGRAVEASVMVKLMKKTAVQQSSESFN
ncbi:hypothetical protein CRE_27164 [Caenorhabditis remanei]|uniref:Serpentine Receptor, class BC (Class B-like) n=1 Tax=Caenorhabditis remanei TaxID=31234 RepID=E3LNU1_CAERE|nr:hypothetical protein CRE_27164 [Caenorhabditis remanei]